MNVDAHDLRVVVDADPVPWERATITLDDGWSPYAQATVDVPLLPELALQLDPRGSSSPRGLLVLERRHGDADPVAALSADLAGAPLSTLTGQLAGGPLRELSAGYYRPFGGAVTTTDTTRLCELGLRRIRRTRTPAGGGLQLVFTSDEALLFDYALVDTQPYVPSAVSVRALVVHVLALVGATLEPGDADGAIEAAASTWMPGVRAWDYLAPLVQKAGLRLWCDERRRWHLTDATLTTPGQLSLSTAGTVVELDDDVDRDGEYYDAVVIVYRWTDAAGAQQTAYDIARGDTIGRVLTLTYDTPYPGPGAARAVLARAIGRGRQLTLSAVSDYDATPGQSFALTEPGRQPASGRVASVSWQFPDARMRIRPRGLLEIPPTSWAAIPAGIGWDDVPAGVSWPEFAYPFGG